PGVSEHLAVLGGDDRREVVDARSKQLAAPEEDAGARRQRCGPPGGGGLGSAAHRVVDLVAAREVDLAGLLAGRGVVDGAGATGAAGGRGAVGPVGDAGGHARENIVIDLSRAMLGLLCYKTCGGTW